MYEAEIEEFISTLSVGDKEKKRFRNNITDMISLLCELGLAYPTEATYQEFRERKIQAKPDITKNTLKDRDNRVRNFFKFIIDKELQITMPDLDNTEIVTPELIDEPKPEPVAEAKKSNAGRKKKYAEEHKTKIMIYVTKELEELINSICTAKKMSKTEYIVSILEEHLSKKKELLNQFLEIQELL